MPEIESVKIGAIVEVLWNDAWVDAGVWDADTEVKWPRMAVGYLVEVRDDHVVIAQDWDLRGGGWQTPCVVPLAIVEGFRVLDDAGDRKVTEPGRLRAWLDGFLRDAG